MSFGDFLRSLLLFECKQLGWFGERWDDLGSSLEREMPHVPFISATACFNKRSFAHAPLCPMLCQDKHGSGGLATRDKKGPTEMIKTHANV